MKKNLYLLSILILVFSCQSETKTKEKTPEVEIPEKTEVEIKTVPSKKTKQPERIKEEPLDPLEKKEPQAVKLNSKKLANWVVDQESPYSENFITELRNRNLMKEIEFSKGMMIIKQKDTILFPEIPMLNRTVKLTGRQENLAVALTVERINYTSIKYTLEMVEFGKSSKTTRGIADLGKFFFLGSESDMDEVTHESHFSTEYSTTKDSCYTSIRIGNAEESNDYPLMARIVKNCNGEIRDIDLDNFPTLREK